MAVYIHNFYTDFVGSLRYLFDDYIFKSHNIIQHYQFNIGNRTFQINTDYSTQFRLPAAVITLNDINYTFGGEKTHIIKQIPVPDINQHLVLYNKTKDKQILIQESERTIGINATINCEGQGQVMELKFIIDRFLPTNMFIQLYEFVAFMEIPVEFLQQADFDPVTDEIYNLFQRYDPTTDEITYMFAVKYRPIIKVLSTTPSIATSQQRTFQLNLSMAMIIQEPIYLFSQDNQIVEQITVNMLADQIMPPTASAPVISNPVREPSEATTTRVLTQLLLAQSDAKTEIDESNTPDYPTGKCALKIKLPSQLNTQPSKIRITSTRLQPISSITYTPTIDPTPNTNATYSTDFTSFDYDSSTNTYTITMPLDYWNQIKPIDQYPILVQFLKTETP